MAGQRQSSLLDVDSAQFAQLRQQSVSIIEHRSMQRVMVTVQQIINAAKRYCPVDTGFLRNSLGWVVNDVEGEFFVIFGVVNYQVAYAVFVEYGTSQHPAQPYMRPAIAEVMGFAVMVPTIHGARQPLPQRAAAA